MFFRVDQKLLRNTVPLALVGLGTRFAPAVKSAPTVLPSEGGRDDHLASNAGADGLALHQQYAAALPQVSPGHAIKIS